MLFRPPSVAVPGWVAIATMGQRACAAHVAPAVDQLPSVQWIEHLAWDDAEQGLRRLRNEHQLHRVATVAVLPREHYQLLAMDAPEVPPGEWRDAIRWRLQDMVDFPMADASVDLLEIPAHTSQRGRPAVIAVAAGFARLAALNAAAHRAHVRWQAIDVVECALRNLSALIEPPQRGQALLHVGRDSSTLVLTAGGELLLSRTIDVALHQLLVDGGSHPDNHAASYGDTSAFAAAADRVGLEIQRTLDSFERQFTEVNVARIVVAPGCLTGFIEHVAGLVYVPVEALEMTALFDLAALTDTAALAEPAQQADAWLALGAALRPAGLPQ